ncbi:MAG: hypothetical protein KME45_03020 [Stenomitos rutilans HA7619-LM2]|nr:hypothetical protein [Stenomitos rutilans HA7619-LM2]MBW4469356.1 hypothetical protein [Stenomitos rutilans HA7619-LM2]
MIEALGRLDGMTLEETKAYFYGKEVSDNLEDRSLGESKALLCIAAAPVESLSKYLQAITDRLALIARDNLQHITPINKVAAEFSRSLCTVLVEQKMTLEEISVKCEIELPCLRAVAAGQKVPSHRVAIALQGLLKDFQGRVYEGEDLLEILEQVEPQIVKNVKTPPQQKRRKASQS